MLRADIGGGTPGWKQGYHDKIVSILVQVQLSPLEGFSVGNDKTICVIKAVFGGWVKK